MTDEVADLRVENALLRGSLWLTARRLKDYQDAPAFEIDDEGGPALEVIVPATLREQSAEALAKAQAVLRADPTPAVDAARLQPSRPGRTRPATWAARWISCVPL